jgi:hypothetical protein
MNNLVNFAIDEFTGGIANNRKKGTRGSFKYGQNLNIHTDEGTLTCNQKLKKDSSTTIVDLVLTIIKGSDGAMYGFGDTGKIYRKPSAGSWTLAYTDTDGKITGAMEYENDNGAGVYTRYIYWATQTKLKRIVLSGAGGTWSPTEVGTFKRGIAGNYHTMRVAAGWLMVTDTDHIAIVDREAAFNNEALLLATGTTSKSLLDKDDRLIIGAQDDIEDGWIFNWDKLLDSWSKKDPVQDKGVNSMIFLEGGVMVQTGQTGRLKWWNFSDVHPLKQIPNATYSYPGAVAEYKGRVHIGIQGTKAGVYSLGRKDKNDPLALNLEYIPSHGKITGTEIGSIAKDGDNLYVSWKDGTTYGIDITDTNKAIGVYESLEFDNKRPESTKKFYTIKIVSKTLGTGCKIEVEYKTNRDTDWIKCSMSEEDDEGDRREEMEAGDMIGIFNAEAEGESYQVRVTLTPSGNTAPEIYSINNYFEQGEPL